MPVSPLRFIQGALLALPNMVLPVVGHIPHMAWAILAVFSIAIYQPTIRKNDWLYFLFAFGVIANAGLGVALAGRAPESLLHFRRNTFHSGLRERGLEKASHGRPLRRCPSNRPRARDYSFANDSRSSANIERFVDRHCAQSIVGARRVMERGVALHL
jgi:hypothetical protein